MNSLVDKRKVLRKHTRHIMRYKMKGQSIPRQRACTFVKVKTTEQL